MSTRDRWLLAAALGLPLLTMTAYLLWLWPRPSGSSALAQVGPYAGCLLTGAPFVWRLARGSARLPILIAFFVGGFVALWIFALAVLCGVRGVCL